MKKSILLLLTILLINCRNSNAQFILPPLQAGVYVDTAIASFVWQFTGSCMPAPEVSFSVGSGLTPVVPGVEIKAIVIQLTTPLDSAHTLEAGILHVGDTLNFPSSVNNHYTFFSYSSGGVVLQVIIIVTPTIPFQNYPCELSIICTVANCGEACLLMGVPLQCSVDNFSGVIEPNEKNIFSITPNPVENILTVKCNANGTAIEIFNLLGNSLYKQMLKAGENKINLEFLTDGIYLLRYFEVNRERMIKLVKQ